MTSFVWQPEMGKEQLVARQDHKTLLRQSVFVRSLYLSATPAARVGGRVVPR